MNRQFGDKTMPRSQGWLFALLIAVILCAGLWLATNTVVYAQSTYNYTVQPGDSWDTVAARTGISVAALQAANPDSVRDNGWLLVGEVIVIPAALSSSPTMHQVQAGESWNSIADAHGIPVALLRAANPQAIRAGNVLFRGEDLIIPPVGASFGAPDTPTSVAPTPEAEATESMTEEPSEEAAEATAEPTEEMTEEITEEATAEAVEEEMATPTPEAEVEESETVTSTEEMTEEMSEDATEEAIEEPTEVATEEATEEATAEATPADTMTESEPITATAPMTTGTELTETEEMSEGEEVTTTEAMTEDMASGVTFDLPACPERFSDYAEVMTDLINSADPGPEAVVAFLSACNALVEDGVEMVDLNGDSINDLVVVYQNPSAEQIFVEGDLVIFNSGVDEYALGYRARAAGEVRLLTVDDINQDELPDVAWVDTTCGASTCFDTVNIRSWDGTTWADWTDGTITMAYAEINMTDSMEEGLGEEIELEGGIYGSVGAGPQRSRQEVWASMEGGPYTLVEKAYSETECLYHTVLDANRALLDAPANGFEAALTLYTQAVEDEGLIKCWVRNDELAELRSFSQFRLALIAGYMGESAEAAAAIEQLSTQYPGSIYDEVGQLWLESYESSGDAALACEDVTAYAEENSAAWEMLADYGYTNPSFEAVDVCPLLDMSGAAEEGEGEEETE